MQIIQSLTIDDAISVSRASVDLSNAVYKFPHAEIVETTVTVVIPILHHPEKTHLVLFPIIHPTLATKYLGICLWVNGDAGISLKKNDRYYYWQDNLWCESQDDTPTYYTEEEINTYLIDWCGAIQIEIKLEPFSEFKQLEIAYQVNADLEDWLLKFGIPKKLSIPVELSSMTYCNDGMRVTLPENIDSSLISNILVQPLDGKRVEGNIDDCCRVVSLSSSIAPGAVQLSYTVTPKIDYIEREHQGSELPCVTVEKIAETGRKVPYREQSFFVGNTKISDVHIYTYDLTVEITVLSNQLVEARAIAKAYISLIQREGFIDIPPFALTVGAITEGNLRENDEDKQEAYLSSCSFTLKLVKVPFNA